jgi:ATP phosphoribosyltransferase
MTFGICWSNPDVAIYVEHGAADIGVVGRDILMETNRTSMSCLTF